MGIPFYYLQLNNLHCYNNNQEKHATVIDVFLHYLACFPSKNIWIFGVFLIIAPSKIGLCTGSAVADQVFPLGRRGSIRGGGGGVDLRHGCFSVKMYVQTKELGPVGGACAGNFCM